MKIVFIAEGDAANVLTEYSHCLNNHCNEIQTKTICLFPHPFNYKIKHDINLNSCDNNQIQNTKKLIQESDIVIFAEEGILPGKYKTIDKFNSIFNIDLLDGTKKIIIWHPGSNYRNNYQYYNTHPLRNKVFKHLYAIDLYRLSPKNKSDLPLLPYQYYDFNFNSFILDFKKKLNQKPWIILHIPSNTNTKGTQEIIQTIDKLNLDPSKYVFKHMEKLQYDKVIEEKKKSIFYIDQYKPSVGGYGIASLEGLFTSNLTFATVNNIGLSIKKLTDNNEIGVIPLGENLQTLYETLNYFCNTISENELIAYNEVIGKWVEQYYSPQNIVKFFKTILK